MIKTKGWVLGLVMGVLLLGLLAVFAKFGSDDIRLIYFAAAMLLVTGGIWAGRKADWIAAVLLGMPLVAGFALVILPQMPGLWPTLVLWPMAAIIAWRLSHDASARVSVAGGACVWLVISFWFCLIYVPSQVAGSLGRFQNASAPHFQLDPISDGEIPSGPTAGKILVIDFLATWCAPCIAELPELSKARAELKDRSDIQFVVVGSDTAGDTTQKLQSFAQKRQINIPLAFDPGGKAQQSFGLSGYPTLVVLDRAQHIRFTHQGYNDSEVDFRQNLVAFLKSL